MTYDTYILNRKEWIMTIISGSMLMIVIAELFYGRLWVAILISPAIFFYTRFIKGVLKERRQKQLKKEFRDFVISLADAMKVGYSVENGLTECRRELTMIYGFQSLMVAEINEMLKRVSINESVEKVFQDFAERSESDDIKLFAQIFTVSKRTGGRVNQLMGMVADSINDSFLVDEEIQVVVSEKRMEQLVMSFVPAGIIVYLQLTSPDLVTVLHHTLVGNMIMTACLVAYAFAVYLGYVIIDRGELFD